ncbi:hypothetical protein GCM10027073_30480 [Streptomyces chlorus]
MTGGMDRGRCGLLVEARNAPWQSPEGYSGIQVAAITAVVAAAFVLRVSPYIGLLIGCRWGRAGWGDQHEGRATGPRVPGERHTLTLRAGARASNEGSP